ncbi:uncharacterized protein TM35_000033260 [Trypanosoma theileri]|uniref:Uncharacterized protein n=1 Tax=Trypanosoma theileri TaxID=67003 RepID=A0A1X0P7H5_9TRYP|nr:uncharacterized protein TM35_000033260 [Trypanosoma theileri]ORC92573.1 hypothetical protein TM35_000033260 [Trypanosoma theileri]
MEDVDPSTPSPASSTSNAGIAPLFIPLDIDAPLPSKDYVRFIALSGANDTGNKKKGQNGDSNANNVLNGVKNLCSGEGDDSVVRRDFALHMRGARLCRLLETMLDAADLQIGESLYDMDDGRSMNKSHRGKDPSDNIPPVVLPQATERGCNALFFYLEMTTTRLPTVLSKPLRAPLEELVQPWELKFLLCNCMDDATSHSIAKQISNTRAESKKGNCDDFDATASYYRVILNGAPKSLDLLLEVAMLSDFLLIEPLRQLTCAFLASLALNAPSENELLRLCGLQRALTEEELDPVYAQFPFLRPENVSEA